MKRTIEDNKIVKNKRNIDEPVKSIFLKDDNHNFSTFQDNMKSK
jgi:hypothetical protein